MAKNRYYVYSTLSADTCYAGWEHNDGNNFNEMTDRVVVKGGAGVANKNFMTPRGVVTDIDQDQYDFLMKHDIFLLHKDRGFVSISEARVDAEVVVADMTQRDKSSPLVPGDFSNDDPKVVVNRDPSDDGRDF